MRGDSKSKKIMAIVAVSLLITLSFLAGYSVSSNGNKVTTISSGIYPNGVSYTIYKEGSTYYAKDAYGAIDFSGTDASTVIQSAVNTLVNGGKIFIKAANYPISNTISIPFGGIVIEGEGWSTILEAVNNFNKNIIEITGDYCEVKDLRINGNKANQASGKGIYVYNAYRVKIERVFLWQIKGCSIELAGNASKYCIETVINKVYIEDGDGAGIRIGDYATDTRVSGNNIQVDADNGIIVVTGSNLIIDNTVWGNINGLLLYGSSAVGNLVIGNRFDYNWYYGIYIDAGATGNLITGNNIFFNSQASSNTYSGIIINDSFKNNIFNNRIGSSYTGGGGEKQKYGVKETGTSDYNEICFNIIESYLTNGIVKVGANTVVKQNVGYVTENSGTATISSGTSVVVTHGLAGTPTVVIVTPRSTGYGSFAVTARTSTTFTITVTISGTYTFDWYAEYKP